MRIHERRAGRVGVQLARSIVTLVSRYIDEVLADAWAELQNFPARIRLT